MGTDWLSVAALVIAALALDISISTLALTPDALIASAEAICRRFGMHMLDTEIYLRIADDLERRGIDTPSRGAYTHG